MESTWAGDYLDEYSFNKFEASEKPYLIHWAGTPVKNDKYINKYFFRFLSEDEKSQFLSLIPEKKSSVHLLREKLRSTYNFIKTL
jgi:hypothetical protein